MSKRSPRLLIIISTVFIVLFTYTAANKLVDLPRFMGAMLNQPFPETFNSFLIFFVPSAELVVVGLLLFSKTRLSGLYLSLGLMIAFTTYIGLILLNVFGKVPCSCGGILESLSWEEHFGVNMVFVALGMVGVFEGVGSGSSSWQ